MILAPVTKKYRNNCEKRVETLKMIFRDHIITGLNTVVVLACRKLHYDNINYFFEVLRNDPNYVEPMRILIDLRRCNPSISILRTLLSAFEI
jgi:hypothetical protein